MREFRVDLQLGNELTAVSASFKLENVALIIYLLRQLRRLHLRLDDLESDNVSGRLAAIVSLCAVADGETAFSERRASRIVDARRLGDDWRRRLSVDGRHCRCRWPSMHKCCACLRWAISKDGRLVGVESLRLHQRRLLGCCPG